jgi:membrane protease YdiL (CAAX protease family)
METQTVDWRRVGLFIFFAFLISWTTAAVIYFTGGLVNSPVLVPGTGLSLAFILLLFPYMWGPALANVLTRLFSREGSGELLLGANLRRGWPYYLAAWFLPGILTMLGAALFFLVFPSLYDPELGLLQAQVRELTGIDLPVPSAVFVVLQAGQAILLSPILNVIGTFGEEFGWRGYLQPKLMPLGGRKAVLLVGVVWGVWHWPVIAMGYNYGFDYPGAPWLGPLAMVWFTLVLGVFFGWVTIKSESVWPAVIAHGAINGIAALGTIFLSGAPNTLLGPAPTGVLASVPFTLLALLLLFLPGGLKKPVPPPQPPLVEGSAPAPRLSRST